MSAWNVLTISRVVDGDTVRLIRSRVVGIVDGLRIEATDVEPVAVRLIHVDTPERGEVGWADAKRDLETWINAQRVSGGVLTLLEAGRDNFGRLLGDLKTRDGYSASLHLIRDKGWPTWMETR